MSDRATWEPHRHEAAVERFYATGREGFHDFHGGYLNFGYWSRPGMRYEEAAEELVRRTGGLLGLGPSARLLDVGCGMGSQDIYLHRTFRLHSIDALDVTWVHVDRARERARRAGVGEDRLRFHHGTATALPFPAHRFTHLLSIEAPEHFDTREDFFREAHRVLAPGGVLALCDYSAARPPMNVVERSVVECARRLWHVPAANVYGNTTFEEKLRAAGFIDIAIQDVGRWTIPGYYHEHRRPETVRAVVRVRGVLTGVIGGYLIDRGVYEAFRRGLLEYILVRAVKPTHG